MSHVTIPAYCLVHSGLTTVHFCCLSALVKGHSENKKNIRRYLKPYVCNLITFLFVSFAYLDSAYKAVLAGR